MINNNDDDDGIYCGSYKNSMIGKIVLVRTFSAGVHFGELLEKDGREVLLGNARRIWSWSGANTLNEISLNGVDATSRISMPVERIILTEAIELIPLAEKAIKVLAGIQW